MHTNGTDLARLPINETATSGLRDLRRLFPSGRGLPLTYPLSRSQPFRASPRQRAMAVVGVLRAATARREAVFRLSSSLTLVAAAFARGARAFCHHVRVRALGAIMCAWHCLQTLLCRQSDHRSPSPRALCRRDDSTWSMPRRAPSEVARLFIVRFNMLQNLTTRSPAHELIAAVLAVS